MFLPQCWEVGSRCGFASTSAQSPFRRRGRSSLGPEAGHEGSLHDEAGQGTAGSSRGKIRTLAQTMGLGVLVTNRLRIFNEPDLKPLRQHATQRGPQQQPSRPRARLLLVVGVSNEGAVRSAAVPGWCPPMRRERCCADANMGSAATLIVSSTRRPSLSRATPAVMTRQVTMTEPNRPAPRAWGAACTAIRTGHQRARRRHGRGRSPPASAGLPPATFSNTLHGSTGRTSSSGARTGLATSPGVLARSGSRARAWDHDPCAHPSSCPPFCGHQEPALTGATGPPLPPVIPLGPSSPHE